MLPTDCVALHKKEPWHLACVANRHARDVALGDGANRACHEAHVHELRGAALLQAKATVEWQRRAVCYRARLRPECCEECFSVGSCALVNEEDRREVRLRGDRRAQVANRLATELSAKVAQEDNEGGSVPQLLSQRAGPQVVAFNRMVEQRFRDSIHTCRLERPKCARMS
jgi:hypothetical protein